MPLRIVRGSDNQALWAACTDGFLERAADNPGPGGHPAWIWLGGRALRDLLMERARAHGVEGWLGPPVALLGDLPALFDIRDKPVGLLTRRRLLSRIANRLGGEILGQAPGRADGIVRGHMLDALLADLLPEGVEPSRLRVALDQLPADDFSLRRNRWIVEVYSAYHEALDEHGLRDWRSVHALIADRIERGELPRVLDGARELHVYGLTNPRTRRRLLAALAGQSEVDVHLYLLAEPEADEFEPLAENVERLPDLPGAGPSGPERPAVTVQPVPDTAREMDWVARQVKALLHAGDVEPHEVAVVARSGRADTRHAVRALERAGVPATARIRTPLNEIAALKALLLVFRGAARDWDYRTLRAVLAHPYFDTGVDLRSIDFIASSWRVEGLGEWEDKIERLPALIEAGDRSVRGSGLFADRLERDLERFGEFRAAVEPLGTSRSEAGWIDLTLGLLGRDPESDHPRGLLYLRRRLCDPVAGRWDIVRLDQRGLVQVERLLREWRELDHPDEPLEPATWYAVLSRLLEGNELVLSTPLQKGVQVLEAHDAALVPFRHVFVVHANDGEFPRVGRSTGVLSNEERVQLRAGGLPLSHREESLRRERSLWRAVTGQAGNVRITYCTADAGGTPLLPSLMVPEHDPSQELPRTRRPRRASADWPSPVSSVDADRLAVQRVAETLAGLRSPGVGGADSTDGPGATGGRDDGQAGGEAASDKLAIEPANADLARHAIVAAVAEWHRGPGLARSADAAAHPATRPNPWNGKLRDPDVLALLEEHFSPEYCWSAGQLETYGRCPFSFLVERILHLEALEEAEEETTPLTFGGVAHDVLERFYSRLLARAGGGGGNGGDGGDGGGGGDGGNGGNGKTRPLPTFLDAASRDLLHEVVGEVCREREEAGEWLGLPPLWAVTRQSVLKHVAEYLEWELEHIAEKGERPHLVEHEFGFGDEPVVLEAPSVRGDTVKLRLRGRIDRVDEKGTQPIRYHVLDYKSSQIPARGGYEDGSTLQSALYLKVVADHLGLAPGTARYRAIKKPGKPQNGAQVSHGSDEYETAIELAFSIPARVRAGLFEPVASAKTGWRPWDVGVEITRGEVKVPEGSRFDADRPDSLAELVEERAAGEDDAEGRRHGEGEGESERGPATDA